MRPSLIIFFANTASMASYIFVPNYALALGASASEIGLLGAANGFAIFISSYFFGRISDVRGRKRFITLGLTLCALAYALQILARDAFSLLLIRAFAGFSFGIFTAPLIAYASESGGKLGVFSSYGALGWAAAGLLAGSIAQYGDAYSHVHALLPYWSVFAFSSLCFLAALHASLGLSEIELKISRAPAFPAKLIRKNFAVYASTSLRTLGAFAVWIIFPLYLAQLGASMFWIGAAYFMNSAAQFFIMRRLDTRSESTLIIVGLAVSALVFFSYTVATNFYQVLAIQIFLAVSYATMYVGSLLYLTKHNEEKASAVGVMNSLTSISGTVGYLFGGALSEAYGYHAALYFASALAALGFGVSMRVRK